MLLTLTANLLAETTYTFDAWTEGATQRAREEFFQVGGKGINVTRMLKRFGVESLALCFPGGASGARCAAWLEQRGIPHRAFPVTAETRTGAVVRAPGRAETTFLGTENDVAAEAIAACAAFLDARPDGEILAIGGSIPAWAGVRWDPLRAAIRRWMPRGRLIVDSYGPPLPWLAALPVWLAKINRREFGLLAGIPLTEATDARMPELLAQTAAACGVERWVVTDGPNAVWFCERGAAPTMLRPPPIEEVSPTGSGDVFLASVVFAMERRGYDLAKAVEFALPIAAANAASPEVAELDLSPFGFPASG